MRLPADPPSFEVWYAHLSGQRPEVSAAVNEALARDGTLTVAALDLIHRQFFPTAAAAEDIDTIGHGLGRQTGQVLDMLDSAVASTGSFGACLAQAGRAIDESDSRALRGVIANLVAATRAAEAQNRTLHGTLSEARQEIGRLQADLAAVCAANFTDPVTGIANRKSFETALPRAIAEARADGTPLALLMCDIDHFKRINDAFGHLTGDHALRLGAQALRLAIRGEDPLARFGGEEFAILLPRTNAAQATIVGENVRASVSRRPVIKRSTGENLGTLTISVGVAELQADDVAESLVERADTCLYIAKQRGRNQVVHVPAEEAAAFDWRALER
jgi:diguanylate cyclase